MDSLHITGSAWSPPARAGDKAQLSTGVRSARCAGRAFAQRGSRRPYSAPLAYQLFARQTVGARMAPSAGVSAPEVMAGSPKYPGRTWTGDVMGRIAIGLAAAAVGCWCWRGGRGAGGVVAPGAAGAGWRAIWRGQGRAGLAGDVLTLAGWPCWPARWRRWRSNTTYSAPTRWAGRALPDLKSIRTALVIPAPTTLVTLPWRWRLGIVAGYLGGWVDDVIQYPTPCSTRSRACC